MKNNGTMSVYSAQKGSRVEWFDGHKKGFGTVVSRVVDSNGTYFLGWYHHVIGMNVTLDGTNEIRYFPLEKLRRTKKRKNL